MHMIKDKKVFISGAISSELHTYKAKFAAAEAFLTAPRSVEEIQQEKPHCIVMNPAILPLGFEHEDYIAICITMIDACDTVVFLHDWESSPGAQLEMRHAKYYLKEILFFDDIVAEAVLDQLIDLRSSRIMDGSKAGIEDAAAISWAIRNIKKTML